MIPIHKETGPFTSGESLKSDQKYLSEERTKSDRKEFSREQHRNMYTIKGETDHQPRLDA